MIQKRLRGFLHLVVGSRIAALRSGKPVITSTTNKNAPKEVQEGFQLNYLYETMQQQRTVPLSRYGIYPSSPGQVYVTPYLSLPLAGDEETERARNHAIHLMAENHSPRAQITVLEQDKNEVIVSNEKLAQKVATLRRGQPAGYISPWPSCSNDTFFSKRSVTPSNRSLRQVLAEDQCGAMVGGYEEVFSRLQDSSLPELRLSDPETGELSPARPRTPTTPSENKSMTASGEDMTSEQASYDEWVPRTERRNGMLFVQGTVGHLAELGEEAGGDVRGDDVEYGREVQLIIP